MTDRKRRLRGTFDAIADEFAATRDEPWLAVEDWVAELEGGEVALDVGCGNGRHLPVLAERFARPVGIDAAPALLRRAPRRFGRVLGDLEALPCATDTADAAICVAALHHVPGRDGRLRALAELDRVLVPCAPCLVTVWAITHGRFDGMRDAIRAKDGDVTIPWTDDEGDEHPRYYHIYRRDEFLEDLEDAAPAVDGVWEEDGNFYASLRASDGVSDDGAR